MLREKNKPTSSEGNRDKIFIRMWKGQEGSQWKIFKCRRHHSWMSHLRWVLHCREGALGAAPNCRSTMAPLHCHFPFLCDALAIGQGHCRYSLFQLRGISAFQGRKSAFLVFHFTAWFSVWEFQNAQLSQCTHWGSMWVLHSQLMCLCLRVPWPLRCISSALYTFRYHSIGWKLIVINCEGLCWQPLSSYGYISKKLWNKHFKALGRETNWLLQNSWMIITHLLIMLINNWCKIF